MIEQLEFSFLEDYKKLKPKYTAIYFIMGQHHEPPVGFDCPFDDSPILEVYSEKELDKKIYEVFEGEIGFDGFDFRTCYPDIICNKDGENQVELYQRLCNNPNFDPDKVEYSFGRETMVEFWEREKWRWFPE